MRRPFQSRSDAHIPRDVAVEMFRVGIVPSGGLQPIGSRGIIAGQPYVVTGYATREEFLQAVADAGMDEVEAFEACPENLDFLRISTD